VVSAGAGATIASVFWLTGPVLARGKGEGGNKLRTAFGQEGEGRRVSRHEHGVSVCIPWIGVVHTTTTGSLAWFSHNKMMMCPDIYLPSRLSVKQVCFTPQ